jgi:hypothetical protein
VAQEIRGPAGRCHLGLSWGHLGPSWAVLGPSWAMLGCVGLTSSWGHLRLHCGHLVGVLGHIGVMLAILGLSWAILGSTWPSWVAILVDLEDLPRVWGVLAPRGSGSGFGGPGGSGRQTREQKVEDMWICGSVRKGIYRIDHRGQYFMLHSLMALGKQGRIICHVCSGSSGLRLPRIQRTRSRHHKQAATQSSRESS